MKQLKKDIAKELNKLYHGIKSCKEATEDIMIKKIIEVPPSAEMAFTFTLKRIEKTNRKISEIIDRYQEKFEEIEELIKYSEKKNKILEHIENRVKELAIARLRAQMTGERTWKAYLNGQIKVYKELYMMIWEQQQKIVQLANTRQETR